MSLKSVDLTPPAEGWGLVIAFQDPSSSFCNGFEAGGIFQCLKTINNILGSEEEPLTVHTENLALYGDMATHFNCDLFHKDTEVEGWTYIWFSKKQATLKLV